jgi:hypothetical protein
MSFGTLTTVLNTPLKLNTLTTTIINTRPILRYYPGWGSAPSGHHTFEINKFENKYSFIYSPPNRSSQTLENIIVNNSGLPFRPATATFNVSKSLGKYGFLLNEFDDENVAKQFMKDTTTKLKVDKTIISYFPDNPDFIQGFVLFGYDYYRMN